MDRIISYREIPKYADTVDREDPPSVLLSRFQAHLYKRLTQHKLRPLGGLLLVLDQMLYWTALIIILSLARNLLLLGYFHHVDEPGLEVLRYEKHHGQVLLRFQTPEGEVD